jgi:hypothetical protein
MPPKWHHNRRHGALSKYRFSNFAMPPRGLPRNLQIDTDMVPEYQELKANG